MIVLLRVRTGSACQGATRRGGVGSCCGDSSLVGERVSVGVKRDAVVVGVRRCLVEDTVSVVAIVSVVVLLRLLETGLLFKDKKRKAKETGVFGDGVGDGVRVRRWCPSMVSVR